MSESELMDLLRENYWYLDVTGSRALSDLWGDVAHKQDLFQETLNELGVTMKDYSRAASLLAEWFVVNDLLHKSPMEQSVEIRTEKLQFPEGPQ